MCNLMCAQGNRAPTAVMDGAQGLWFMSPEFLNEREKRVLLEPIFKKNVCGKTMLNKISQSIFIFFKTRLEENFKFWFNKRGNLTSLWVPGSIFNNLFIDNFIFEKQ